MAVLQVLAHLGTSLADLPHLSLSSKRTYLPARFVAIFLLTWHMLYRGTSQKEAGAKLKNSSAPEDIPHSGFTGANVLVEELRAFHTHKTEACRSHCCCNYMCLPAARGTVQQHACAQTKRCPAQCTLVWSGHHIVERMSQKCPEECTWACCGVWLEEVYCCILAIDGRSFGKKQSDRGFTKESS